MDLVSTIQAYDEATSQQQLDYFHTRDGRAIASLPRVSREIMVSDATHSDAKVTAADAALLCEEARLAIAEGLSEEARGAIAAELALLEAGLRELLGELQGPTTT